MMFEFYRMLAAVKRLPARDGAYDQELSNEVLRSLTEWKAERQKLRAVSRPICALSEDKVL